MFNKIHHFLAQNLFQSQNNSVMASANTYSANQNAKRIHSKKNRHQFCPLDHYKSLPNGVSSFEKECVELADTKKPKRGLKNVDRRNPVLKITENGFDQPFVSKFNFYLSSDKIDLVNIKKGLPERNYIRSVFNQYPIYLQHTLFIKGKEFDKLRHQKCSARVKTYDQLRQKGNELYNKGQYYEALEYYEQAMSLFRWLQIVQPSNQKSISAEKLFISQQFPVKNDQRLIKALKQLKEISDVQLEQLESKFKQFFIIYSDENTQYFNGQELVEKGDIDIRNSLLVQIYLNMCAAYLQTHHYSLAEKVCDDGLTLLNQSSQLYYRKAQSYALRKDSSLQQLENAKRIIEIAVEKRKSEKIFTTTNQKILKILNLHDSEQAYEECKQLIDQKITFKNASNSENYEKVLKRIKQIHENSELILAEGRIPRQPQSQKLLEETIEMKLLTGLQAKYIAVIDFFKQSQNFEQIVCAKRQFQQVLRAKSEVNEILQVKMTNRNKGLRQIKADKLKKWLTSVKKSYAEAICNASRFNFEMIEWVIKDIVKQENLGTQKKEAGEKKETEKQEKVEMTTKKEYGVTNLLYILLFVPLLVMLMNLFVL